MKGEGIKPATIRVRLSAFQPFTHLVERRATNHNPVREIRRPKVNRRHGTTAAHADPVTTKRYDRRGFNAEKASFFSNH